MAVRKASECAIHGESLMLPAGSVFQTRASHYTCNYTAWNIMKKRHHLCLQYFIRACLDTEAALTMQHQESIHKRARCSLIRVGR